MLTGTNSSAQFSYTTGLEVLLSVTVRNREIVIPEFKARCEAEAFGRLVGEASLVIGPHRSVTFQDCTFKMEKGATWRHLREAIATALKTAQA